MEPAREKPVVREVTCKTILNRSSLGDYSLNCYGGCTHGCVYCYARYMERFHPHPEPWGRFVDVKANAVEVLERQVKRMPPGDVFVSSACDGWQPIEAERCLTRECCRILVEHGFKVSALTKSALVARDIEILSGHDACVGITVTTLNPDIKPLWEPHTSSVEARFGVSRKAHEAGLETSVMFGPLLPFLSDSQDCIDALLERAADEKIDRIWVDAMNPRANVWASVNALLSKHFPDLVERYQRIFFWPKVREAYLAGVRDRVARAVGRLRLSGRVSACM